MSAVLALADDVGLGPDHLLFSSVRFSWLKTLKRRRSEFQVQGIVGLFDEEPTSFSDPLFDTFNPRHTHLTLAELKIPIDNGLTVNPFTVNDPETMSRVIELGVAGLITDFPQRVRR